MGATIHCGDALAVLRTLPDESVHCCVTSPPYFRQRDYRVRGQIGIERTPEEFIARLIPVFEEVRRVLVSSGTCWIVIGDSYANDSKWGGATGGKHVTELHGAAGPGRGKVKTGLPAKSLIGIPWRLAFALQAQGWVLRAENIWDKPNGFPQSVKDRTTRTHEQVFHFSKGSRYYYDADAIREPHLEVPLARAKRNRFGGKFIGSDPAEHGALKRGNGYGPGANHDLVCNPLGRNKRSVWRIPTEQSREPHFAQMPRALAKTCILAGCPEGGSVLDPFVGSGTSGIVAVEVGLPFIGIDIDAGCCRMAERRIHARQRMAS